MHHTKRLLPTLFIVAGLAATGLADDEITGEWALTMDFGGQDLFATLTISQKDDGSYTGSWGSTELSDVTFDGEKLTFNRVGRFGDFEFTMNFDATLRDGMLVGAVSNPQGELTISGARLIPKSPALGHWDLDFKIQDQEMQARLSVTQDADGALDAEWIAEYAEVTVNSVSFQDGELTVDRTVKFQDQEYDVPFVAEVDGDSLTGTFESEFAEIPATGTRFGTELIGTWELTATTDERSRTRLLTIFPDLTGRYDFFLAEIPVEVTLEGEQVTFHWEMKFGENTLATDFTGTLNDGNLTGELVSPRGTSQITGEKLDESD